MEIERNNEILKKGLLGEILLKRNIITPKQLEHALAVQKTTEGCIGEILVQLGFAEEVDIVVALIVQCNFAYIAVTKYEIEKNILQIIPKDFAFKHHVIPLDRVGDILSVVMVDPLDLSTRAELHRVTQYKIAPFITTGREMKKALEQFYANI